MKKTICHSVAKTFDFSQNYSVLFHRVTFDYTFSCVLLIDKPAKTPKNLKEMPYPPHKNLLKRKGNSITPAKTNVPISQTYQMRNKELKKKLGQLQKEISKASLPVSADLCNIFKSIILETDQIKIYPS